ncbi:MAG: adenylate/guanylate cyclase domain-containing protein [Flavobacteriaceae bacterium]
MPSKIKAFYFLIGLYCFNGHFAIAQDQRIADSLLGIYQTDTLDGEARLELLKNLSFNAVDDYHLALKYADELIALATEDDNLAYQAHGYLRKGNAEKLMGNLEKALAAFFETAEIAKKNGRIPLEGSAYINIADIYAMANNHKNAMHYYQMAIATLRKSDDSISLASAILNAGDAHLTNKDYDSALVYFKESGAIFERSNYLIGKAYNLGNIGMVYAGQGQIDLAEKNIDEAIQILIAHGDYYPISVYLQSMADIFLEKGDRPTALNYAKRSLALATQYGLKEQISTANLKLSELYEAMGLTTESLMHYKEYIAARDTLNNISRVQTLADMRTDYEISQKQVEVDLLNTQKRNQLIILVFSGVLLLTLFWYYRTISKEKKRSENLLLNILPSEIAHELKQKGAVEAVKCDEVTVLFTDFVQFSKKAENITPEKLVKSIDFYFKKFDEITTKYGLEKIKTIGDSYMCASGIPSPDPKHASNAIRAAKEMTEVVKSTLNDKDDLSHFEVRVGLHSGPVVAGIVGIKKWQYDIWGDTVNIASRMESNSEPGRINLSETTYDAIKEEFACEYRGEIEVKNRGLLKMYYLSQ